MLASNPELVIPPEMVVKRVRWNEWLEGWETVEVVTGPEWMRDTRDDPHQSKEEARIVRVEGRMVVPELLFVPTKRNIIGGGMEFVQPATGTRLYKTIEA